MFLHLNATRSDWFRGVKPRYAGLSKVERIAAEYGMVSLLVVALVFSTIK